MEPSDNNPDQSEIQKLKRKAKCRI